MSSHTPHPVQAANLTARLDAANIVSLLLPGGTDLLRAPAYLEISEWDSPHVLRLAASGASVEAGGIAFRQEWPEAGLGVEFRVLAARELTLEISLQNRRQTRRDMVVSLVLPCAARDLRLFVPGGNAHPSLHRPLAFGYRDEGAPLTMPATTLYRHGVGGVTFFGDFAIPITPYRVTTLPAEEGLEVRLQRRHLRLEGGASVTTTLHLAGHGGDWRPGLGYLRERYADYFTAPTRQLDDWYGAFLYSSIGAPGQWISRWAEEGVKAVEIHYTYSFLGRYVPTEEPWVRAVDDRWAYEKVEKKPGLPPPGSDFEMVKAYLDRTQPRTGSKQRVRDLITTLRQHGIHSLIYYQPSECWDLYARKYYPEGMYRTFRGREDPVWFENMKMDMRLDSAWGRYVADQFRGLLQMYPDVDGVFMDEATYDQLDFAPGADDGFSIYKARVAYRVGRAICQLSEILCREAREQGKVVWWNGPYTVEIARYADGMMAEGGGLQGERIQYLDIGNKPTCCLSLSERQYKRNLVLGLWPTSPSLLGTWMTLLGTPDKGWEPPAPERVLHSRYLPLFRHFKSKTWVLTESPLTLPTGLDGNIFHTPEGGFVVTVVNMEQNLDSRAFWWDVPIGIQVSGAEKVRAVYLLTPDCRGRVKLPCWRDGNRIQVVLPRLRSAAMLILATGGTYVALAGDEAVTRGREASLRLALDNWSSHDEAVTVQAAALDGSYHIPAGSSLELPLSLPATVEASEHASFPVSVRWDGREENYTQEVWADEPVAITWQGRPGTVLGKPQRVKVWFSNHGREAVTLHPRVAGQQVRLRGLPRQIRLLPGERRLVEPLAEGLAVGVQSLSITAPYEGGVAQLEMPVEVWADTFSPAGLVPILSAAVRLEMFTPDGAPDLRYASASAPYKVTKTRPVYLNGQRIGEVPSRNNTFWRTDGFTVGIPAHVLPHLRRHNEVTMEADGPADAYKVRNLAIELELVNGRRLSSLPDTNVYTARPCDFAEGKIGSPIRVYLDFDDLEREERRVDDWNHIEEIA
ncbi:MAG: hypothetical protein IT330_13645 [Anaerolineae bacterium]|nr:hypothetical protein [Anaerolineae bacterium]